MLEVLYSDSEKVLSRC